jgi:hypothetical protein
MSIRTVLLSAAVSFAAVSPAFAGGIASTTALSSTAISAVPATPAQRGAAIRLFVRKWGAYVHTIYDVDVHDWAMRLVPQFAHGDSTNLRAALQRQTFEGAMAALNGTGHRLSDDRVIAALASLPPGASAGKSRIVARALGDVAQDLVYTPITPCRIVDTRNTVAGSIGDNASRSFAAAGEISYGGQGGSASNCGMGTEAPSAVALNVTVVGPTQAGYATVFPFGETRPATSSLNFSAGQIANNAIISKIPSPAGSFDFTIFSLFQAHYVVDIVGYFDNPRSSPVECVNTTLNIVNVPVNGTANLVANTACPAGYGPAGLNCESSSWDMPIVSSSGSICSAKNKGATSADLRAGLRCCRIPGR